MSLYPPTMACEECGRFCPSGLCAACTDRQAVMAWSRAPLDDLARGAELEADRLRQEAFAKPPGLERDRLLRRVQRLARLSSDLAEAHRARRIALSSPEPS